MQTSDPQPGFAWLIFSLMTVIFWGLYGVLLHNGQVGMGDPVNGRYKAFLFVGLAYVLAAVLAPLAGLALNGATWKFPASGIWWSLTAGIAGAVGAFCVLLAFGAKGSPAAVMSIVFGGAPIVNAIVALLIHPPAEGWGALRWQFFLGIALAAIGGSLVTLYKPAASKIPPPIVSKAK
jgi:drug/metabolite transporter (DMT)-like permease